MCPHQTGELHIVGLAFNLGTSSPYQAHHIQQQNQANADQSTSALEGQDSGDGNQSTPTMSSANKPSYISSISVLGQLSLEVQGPRLNNTKDEKTSKMYGPDRRLDIVVAPPMPKLQVGNSYDTVCLVFGRHEIYKYYKKYNGMRLTLLTNEMHVAYFYNIMLG